MRDCDWIKTQLAVDNVRWRAERRAARLERVGRILRLRRSPTRPAPVLVDARRG